MFVMYVGKDGEQKGQYPREKSPLYIQTNIANSCAFMSTSLLGASQRFEDALVLLFAKRRLCRTGHRPSCPYAWMLGFFPAGGGVYSSPMDRA